MKRHPNAGRRIGTPNKKSILRVSEVLIAKEVNPTEEILKLIPLLEPEDQLKAWGLLLSYTETKPRENDEDPKESTADVVQQLRDVSDSKLIAVIEHQKKSPHEEE